eukprot:TRINITY_DN5948_c0_g2_i1.p1 TRINITY_DN5948_c0_g2~~TRINITY_DN5948_c0_g2_i1.p1  ORF type:complete len:2220 (-),score=660.83 TRINITY_DN5948_c0_g2_i1:77-6736(-)
MQEEVWLRHPEYIWAPCKAPVGASAASDHSCTTEYGDRLTVAGSELAAAERVELDQLEGVDDVCSLKTVNEAALLHTIRVRYAKGSIYTRISRILVSVNPFGTLPATATPLYSAQQFQAYASTRDAFAELPPHIFAVGQAALLGFRTGTRDQAVLISGESGAGKTESAKLILSFVTDAVKGGGQGRIEDRVRYTNPVLEAFGNAMTVRNSNSSRFGKWLDLRFSPSLRIQGCNVSSYLLETTRVCGTAADERNYHIFFMLLQGRSTVQCGISSLRMGQPSEYKYLKAGQMVAPGVDDSQHLDDLMEAFEALGFSQDVQAEVFRTVAGVLVLGNCEFSSVGEGSKFSSDGPVTRAAELFGVSAKALSRCMLFKRIAVGSDVTDTPLTVAKAEGARDAIARLVYGRLFLWLIHRMNQAMASLDGFAASGEADSAAAAAGQRLLGVLDIAGFECFETNSLEQLLINLSNEHLQQQFCRSVFKEEMEDCSKEGVTLSVQFVDNSDCLNFLDGKGGILDVLDEEVAMPSATDMTYVSKVIKLHEKNKRLVAPKFPGKPVFGIKHYAGEVSYTCTGFLAKNADRPPDELEQILLDSRLQVMHAIAVPLEDPPPVDASFAVGARARAGSGRASHGARKPKSVAVGFRSSLRSLMAKIAAADTHYIRCVKPNKERIAMKFESEMVREQLLLSGVLEAVQIRRLGYASRLPFEAFTARYSCLLLADQHGRPRSRTQSLADPKDDRSRAERLLRRLTESADGGEQLPAGAAAVFGATKVFLNASAYEELEKRRRGALEGVVILIERIWRGYKARRRVAGMRRVGSQVAAWLRKSSVFEHSGSKINRRRMTAANVHLGAVAKLGSAAAVEAALAALQPLLAEAAKMGLHDGRVFEAEKTKKRMKQELECLQKVAGLHASTDGMEMKAVLTRASDLGLESLDAVEQLQQRVEKLEVQLPLVQLMQTVTAAGEASVLGRPSVTQQMRSLVADLRAAGLDGDSKEWLPELGARDLAKKSLELNVKLEASQKAAAAKSSAPAAAPKKRASGSSSGSTRSGDLFHSFPAADREALLKLHADLSYACDVLDAKELGRLIGEAVRLHFPKEELSSFKHVFESLHVEAFLRSSLREAQAAADEGGNAGGLPMLRLRHVVRQMRKLGIEDEAVASALKLLQTHSKRCTMRAPALTNATDVLASADGGGSSSSSRGSGEFRHMKSQHDEMKQATEFFSDISNFQGLKAKLAAEAAAGDTQAHGLCHAQEAIDEALTKVPQALEDSAVRNFRDLLVCMYDSPAQGCQRSDSQEAIVALATSQPALRDEIYIQLLKQMTNNTSEKSVLAGWKLLESLCKSALPGDELIDFVMSFVNRSVPQALRGRPSAVPGKRPSSGGAAARKSVYIDEATSLARECFLHLTAAQGCKGNRRGSYGALLTPGDVAMGGFGDGHPASYISRDSLRTSISHRSSIPGEIPWPPEEGVRSVPLLKFKDDNSGNESAYLDPEGVALLKSLPEKDLLCPIILMGDGRGGKSYLASRILGVPDAFISNDTAEPVTEGIDIVAARMAPLLRDAGLDPRDGWRGESETLLLLDCEGGNNAMAAIRTLVNVFGILVGTEVIFTVCGMFSEQSLQTLGTCLAARSLVRLGDEPARLEQKLVFVVNKNTLRFSEDALEQILDMPQKSAERRELRAAVKEAFPERSFCTVPYMGMPEFEESVESFRKTVLQSRSPLEWGGLPVKRTQLQGLLELVVREVQKHSEICLPSVSRYVVLDGFLTPLAEGIAAEILAFISQLQVYDAALAEKCPVEAAMANFDKQTGHVGHKDLRMEARGALEAKLSAAWEALVRRNEVAGDEIVETKTEFREVMVSTRGPVQFGKGLLKALPITLQTSRMEACSVICRRRGGEPERSEWEDTGSELSRPMERSLQSFHTLPCLEGPLFKKNPNMWSTIFTFGMRRGLRRFCLLQDGYFFWWAEEKNAGQGGGAGNAGAEIAGTGDLWVYQPPDGLPIAVRREPDVNAERTGMELQVGAQFRVTETLLGPGDVRYLRLADGRGWLFEKDPDVGVICRRVEAGPELVRTNTSKSQAPGGLQRAGTEASLSSADGTKPARGGYINFLIHHAQVVPSESCDTAFMIMPAAESRLWDEPYPFSGGPGRTFTFNCLGPGLRANSPSTGESAQAALDAVRQERDRWVAALKMHAEFGMEVCRELGRERVLQALGSPERISLQDVRRETVFVPV